MKKSRFSHKISLLLVLIMIFQLIPIQAFAAYTYEVPSLAYDASGTMIVDVQCEGLMDYGYYAGDKYMTMKVKDYRAEVNKGTNEIYLRFNYSGGLYSMVNRDIYVTFAKDTWIKIDLSEWPFDSTGYTDINSNDADDYRSMIICEDESYENIGSLLIHYVDSPEEPTEEVDKSSLVNEMNRVTGDNAAHWYQADDRYNGKEYLGVDGSFWTNMQTTLTVAQSVYEDVYSSQETVTQAVYGMQNSIGSLIPIVNLNTTELYETIKEAEENPPEPFLYPDFTQASWGRYYSVVEKAKELLDSLYDKDGKPTEQNDSSDSKLLSEIEDTINNIGAARESMDPLLAEDDTNDSKLRYNTLNDLLNVYNLERMEESLYTDNSWSVFLDAYESTRQYLDNNSAPGDGEVGKKQYDEIKEQYEKLWRGINGLEDKRESITVILKVVDSLHARLDEDLNDKAGIYTVTLEGDKTLNTAIDKLRDEVLSSEKNSIVGTNEFYATSINGILTTNVDIQRRGIGPLKFKSPERTPEQKSRYAVQLHDGDIVTLAFLEQPVKANSSGTGYDSFIENQLHDLYKQSSILQDGKSINGIMEIDEGQELNLSTIYTLPHISTYSLKANPLSGATVFVSKAAETIEDISPSDINTDIVTGLGGEFSYIFYSPGYYALSVYDLRDNDSAQGFSNVFDGEAPGLTIGDTIYIHVKGTSPEELQVIKEELKKELNVVYRDYPESFFSTDDWKEINNFYETGFAEIDEAITLAEAKEAQDNALNGIEAIQDKTMDDNTSKMEGFRDILSRLPDDASLLGQRNAFLAEALINNYGSMSDYQRNQLTGLEVEKYSDIKKVYEVGLPEIESYKLNLEIAAHSPSAKAAIEDMIEYVKAHGEDTELLYEFKVNKRDIEGKDVYDSHTASAINAYPDNRVRFVSTIDKFAYFFEGDVEGDGWKILDDGDVSGICTDFGLEEQMSIKNRTILIHGVPYEVKHIEIGDAANIQQYPLRVQDSNFMEKGLKYESIVFVDEGSQFIMPYQDVTVTITWGPVDGSIDPDDNPELALAKTNAINQIEEAYSNYRSSNYTDDGWVELTTAKNIGIDEISTASTIEDVVLAKEKAIDAMAVVEEKIIDGVIPDFGDVVGTVDVYVENTTYSGGDFTGTIVRERDFEYAEEDTMMTIVLRALAENGYGWTGTGGSKPRGIDDYEIEYLASITKDGKSLGEFDGTSGSGWMGTLNDFFVNEGFQKFSVSNGKLSRGDEIRVMFTQNLGEDLGGTWGNSDTSLAKLKLSKGTLYPSFDSDINEYTLILPSNIKKLKVTPTASNRNYLVKTFLNDRVTSNKEGVSFYKRTQYIPVRSGDYINIGVGEYAWPSMNNQETEKRNYTGTWYRLNIITPDNGAEHLISLIDELPSIGKITLLDEDEIKSIRDIFEILSSSEQSKVTNIQRLEDVENRIIFFKEIEAVKDLLKKIPVTSRVTLKDKDKIMEADKAYKKLTDKQKLYITVGDVKNYNDAIDKLKELGAFDSGNVPSKIKGSEEIPIEETIAENTVDIKAETKIKNGIANSKVTTDQIKDILKEIEDSDITSITINMAKGKEISKANIEVPKISVDEISKERLDLNLKTPIATISIPNKALKEISKQAKGEDIKIIIDKIKEEKLTQRQKSTVKEEIIYNISIMSKEDKISSFGGKQITISLPYKLKAGQKKDKVSVWHLNDKGELKKIKSRYNEKTEFVIFKTDHLSYYIVGYDNSISFIDVKEDDWFYESVMYAVQKGLFTGTGEKTFSPNLTMTRGMLVTVLYRLDGSPSINGLGKSFIDVKDDQWYAEAIKWTLERSIVKGITDTEFKPENNITREQLAVMLYRYAEIKGLNTEIKGNMEIFTDKENISNWAREAMTWAVGSELMIGKEDNKLSPLANASRSEVSTIFKRFIENVK